jgi:hypothetical protein
VIDAARAAHSVFVMALVLGKDEQLCGPHWVTLRVGPSPWGGPHGAVAGGRPSRRFAFGRVCRSVDLPGRRFRWLRICGDASFAEVAVAASVAAA